MQSAAILIAKLCKNVQKMQNCKVHCYRRTLLSTFNLKWSTTRVHKIASKIKIASNCKIASDCKIVRVNEPRKQIQININETRTCKGCADAALVKTFTVK